MLEQIDHVNIVVEDLLRMTAFYRDMLGLAVTKQVSIKGPWIEQVVALADVSADVVYLDPADGPRLELIHYKSPAGDRPAGLGQPNTQGLRHLAFRVSGIEQIVAKLQAGGIKFFSEVQSVPGSQVQYAGGARKQLVYFQDPEGNLIELCEYAK